MGSHVETYEEAQGLCLEDSLEGREVNNGELTENGCRHSIEEGLVGGQSKLKHRLFLGATAAIPREGTVVTCECEVEERKKT